MQLVKCLLIFLYLNWKKLDAGSLQIIYKDESRLNLFLKGQYCAYYNIHTLYLIYPQSTWYLVQIFSGHIMYVYYRYVDFKLYVLFSRFKVHYVKCFDKRVKLTRYNIIINSCSFSVQRISHIISTVAYPTATECNNYSMVLN